MFAKLMLAKLVKVLKLAAFPAAVFGVVSTASAQHACRDCGAHCPPAFKHVQEKGPRIHVQRGCPNPVCDPCNLPNWGYYATCWSRWPHAGDQAHCRPATGTLIESNVVPAPPSPPPSPPPEPQAPQALPQLPPRNPPPGARPLRPGL
jgi:hypothetical protein